jgi:hypothetical protein
VKIFENISALPLAQALPERYLSGTLEGLVPPDEGMFYTCLMEGLGQWLVGTAASVRATGKHVVVG